VTEEPSKASLDATLLKLLPFQLVFRAAEALLPMLLAAWFGRGADTDANALVSRGFVFAGALLVSAFQDSVFIPTLMGAKKSGHASGLAGAILARAAVLAVLVSFAFGAACLAFLTWTQSQSAQEHGPPWAPSRLTRDLIALYAVHMVLVAMRSFFVGILHAHHNFLAYPKSSGVGMLLTLAIAFVARRWLGIVALSAGLIVGELASLLLLRAQATRHLQVRMNFAFTFEVRAFSKLVSLEALGNLVTRVNPLADQLVASWCGIVGGGTLLGYAFDIASLPTSIAQAVFLSVLLTHLSECADDPSRFHKLLRRSLVYVVLATAAMGVALVLLRTPLASVLFGHGAMDAAGTEEIARIVPYAVIGAPAFAALLVLARAHVALKNTRIMLSMGVLNAGVNGALNLALFPALGLRGIALATSIMNAVVAIVFYLRLPKVADSESFEENVQ
jgi:putative peptidoglycan lipid II flippase